MNTINLGDIITNERNTTVTAKVIEINGNDLVMQTIGDSTTWYLSATVVENGQAGW
jgi:hypothetical protein